MVKRKSFADSACPVARALDVIGDRWSLLVVRDAFDGIRRFSEFHASMKVARNILADRLKNLVRQEILKIVPASDGSAFQEYVLTEKGKSLFPMILILRQWGEGHLYGRGEKHSKLVERNSGRPVRKLEVRLWDGSEGHPEDFAVKKLPV